VVRRIRQKLTEPIDLSGRDEQANVDVAAILVDLPADHAARAACASGKDTIALTHLLADRKDLVKRLIDSYSACSDQVWYNYRGTGPDEKVPPHSGK